MRLFEIENPSLYLHTDREHKSGKVLTPLQRGYRLGASVEGWLERGRPDHMISRSNCIFLRDQATGRAPLIYAVEPLGACERGHTGWLRLLQQPGEKDNPLIDEWIANYWAGNECPSMPGPWEYRAAEVRVVNSVKQ